MPPNPINSKTSCIHTIRAFAPRSTPRRYDPLRHQTHSQKKRISTSSISSHPALQKQALKRHSKSILSTNGPHLPPRDLQLDDIVQGDLTATLDAHRRSNRRNSFRYTYAEQLAASEWSANGVSTADDAVNLDESNIHLGGPSSSQNLTEADTSSQHKSSNRARAAIKRAESRVQIAKQKSDRGPTGSNTSEILEDSSTFQTPASDFLGVVVPPWESQESLALNNRRERLNAELSNFSKWVLPDANEQKFRKLAAFHECQFLKNAITGVDFMVSGSDRTGLATVASDIDIGFVIHEFQELLKQRGPSPSLGRYAVRQTVTRTLTQIQNLFDNSGRFQNLSRADRATHPLVGAEYVGAGIEVQVVYHNDQNQNLDHVLGYLQEYPQLQPVYAFMKSALSDKGIGDPWSGGLGSYPLLMLIVASFRHKKISAQDDIVHGLLSFLVFCLETNFYKQCVSIEPPITFSKKHKRESLSKQLKREIRINPALAARVQLSWVSESNEDVMVLQDPIEMTHNITHNCKTSLELKDFLLAIYNICCNWLREGDKLKDELVPHPLEATLEKSAIQISEKRSRFNEWMIGDNGEMCMVELEEFCFAHPEFNIG